MPQEIHVGDVGTVFEATLVDGDVPLDVSNATTRELLFQTAAGTLVTKTADLTTDGTDGKVQYVTEDADFLATPGWWRWQPRVELPGWTGHGAIADFQVHENLA